jgi:LysM repeat protein
MGSFAFDGTAALQNGDVPAFRLIEGGRGLSLQAQETESTVTLDRIQLSIVQKAALVAVSFLFVVCSFAMVSAIESNSSNYASSVTAGIATTDLTVSPGDSLSQIADEHPIDGLSIEQTVDWLKEENGLSTSTLLVGQHLVVAE